VLNDFERTVAKLAERFAGFFSLMPVLRESFRGERFDHGYPEQYPSFVQHENGVVDVRREPALPEPQPAE
jgi:hypothetical protein